MIFPTTSIKKLWEQKLLVLTIIFRDLNPKNVNVWQVHVSAMFIRF